MLLSSLLLLGATLSSQPRTLCGFCFSSVEIESCIDINWEVKVLNCSAVASISGYATAFAAATESSHGVTHNSCSPYNLLDSYFDAGFVGEPIRNGQVIAGGFASASASVPTKGCDCASSAVVDFAGLTRLYCHMRGRSQGGISRISSSYFTPDGTIDIGYSAWSEAASASSASLVFLDVVAPLDLEYDLTVDWSGQFTVQGNCPESASRRGRGLNVDYSGKVEFVGKEMVLVATKVATGESHLLRGVVAVGESGHPVSLGLFDSTTITIDTKSSGEFQVSGSVTQSFSIASTGGHEIRQEVRRFGVLIGDFNGDGEVLESDYDAVVSSVDCGFDDLCYFASIDFDLDGVITQSEVDRAVAILDEMFPKLTCKVDLNQDGFLNFFDLAMFTGWLNQADPRADWNGDGVINFFDLGKYISDYNLGCFGS